ncbi:MAG: sugar ABC transporter permease [Chloroflexi bacterium]|nr:MAG: sugar ABC transporter permease [Chloroflexota bacterium]
MTTVADDPRLTAEAPGVRALAGLALRRVRQGEIGPLPVIFGLIVIAIIFQTQNTNFLRPLNLTNLMVQVVPFGTIAIGVVLVLLLGEIDLSIGSVSGFCSGIMAVLSVKHGVSGPVSVMVAILSGTAIGFVIGLWRTKLLVPSFVVTLAGLIGFQGALLYILGSTGALNLNDTFITDLANRVLPVWEGWTLAIILVAAYALGRITLRIRRARAGLRSEPMAVLLVRLVFLAGPLLGMVALMSVNRSPGEFVAIEGVPLAVVIFLGLIVVFDLVMRRTRFGRDVYAVGGNEEAARRAGISVDRIRIAVFCLSSTLAAFGGILAASRLLAVNQQSGASDTLLNSIAAAVIGGTSLFGGRGNIWSALLGALVIGSIANGMDLLALESSVKFMITGGVLLAAVTIDAVARRGRQAAGRV